MDVILEVVSPEARRKTWLRQNATLSVGRTEAADFVVSTDPLLSARHFSLESQPQGCRVRDLGSTNGTFVNERRVSECTLADGDRIQAGQTRFVVRISSSPAGVSGGLAPPPAASSSSASVSAGVAAPTDAPLTTAPLGVRSTVPQAPSSALPDAAHVRPPFAEPGSPRAPVQQTPPPSKVTPPVGAGNARPYDRALGDPEPGVRRAALLAAAWTRQKWLLDHCRRVALRPVPEDFDAIWLLAVLGSADDLNRILALGSATALGPGRFDLLGAYGHPRVVELLFDAMSAPDPLTASTAGAAFTRITGLAIDSQERRAVEPGGPAPSDDFDREFLDEVTLPDLSLARNYWHEHRDRYAQSARWCAGFDLTEPVATETLGKLSLPARYEATLRAHWARR